MPSTDKHQILWECDRCRSLQTLAPGDDPCLEHIGCGGRWTVSPQSCLVPAGPIALHIVVPA